MRDCALLFFLVATTTGLWAQIPDGYYNNANGKTGDELKEALHDIIKDHTTISYQQIWNAFWSTDNKGNNVVWDMYSDGANYSYNYTDSNHQCGEYNSEGDCYNREHSWPQSWFSGNDQATPSRDLHHVFPTDGFVNNQRGNNPFGEVSTASWTSQNGSKLGTCKSSLGYNGTVFEPIDEYKGDFARALMYMSVRYYGEDSNWGTSGMTNKSEILPWAMTMLLRWCDEDPVSDKETVRNNAVYGIQNNRNPFIDHPEYARMIWDPDWHESVGGYVKVTSSDDISDGDYLIVYEGGSLAFDGSLATLDAVGDTIAVTISGNTIESNAKTDAAAFTIAAKTGGYSIKSASGYYIGNTSDANVLKTSQNDDYVNTISITDGSADIVSSSSHLRYNSATNQTRFRYYKSSTYTSQQAIQLYKKIAAYSVTLANVEHGSISADATQAVEGATITITATPETGYELDYWSVTDAQNNSIVVANNQFVMPASNVTVSAVFTYVGVFEQKYYLVTDASQLVAGRTYLIVNTTVGKALGTTQNTNNRAAAGVTIANNAIESIDATVCELTLGKDGNYWTLFDAGWGTKGGYLYAASSSSNYLKTQASYDDNGKWAISVASSGVATITAQGGNTRNLLKYNNGSTLFSCYASGQQDVCLFIRSEHYEYMTDTTLACLNTFDKHTVHSGVTLTANQVLGANMLNESNYLVIKDGAQFVHSVSGVKATVKKHITGYSGEKDNYYLIASPVVGSNGVGNLPTGTYDFYTLDESLDSKQWLNYEASAFSTIDNTKGYLYANAADIDLEFAGVLKPSNSNVEVNLQYTSGKPIAGFNLVGNPFPCNAYANKPYYVIEGEGFSEAKATNVAVAPCAGIIVQAATAGEKVTFSKNMPSTSVNQGNLQIALAEAGTRGARQDNAIVSFDEGEELGKFVFNERNAKIYFTQDGKDYAVASNNSREEMSLHFKAAKNGSYTLSFSTENAEMDCLHLIDNLTGADVDLLVISSYTFEAKTTDYASRFQLRFAPKDESIDNAPFAYVSNGEIVITADARGASLQVIDATGRVIRVCTDVVHTVSTIGIPAGMYVLRLLDCDSVRVQKMVIR